MSGHKLTPAARAKRLAARRKIVQAANRFAARKWYHRAPYSMRHVQRCAGICRRFDLVKPSVLIDAGYNPTRSQLRRMERAS